MSHSLMGSGTGLLMAGFAGSWITASLTFWRSILVPLDMMLQQAEQNERREWPVTTLRAKVEDELPSPVDPAGAMTESLANLCLALGTAARDPEIRDRGAAPRQTGAESEALRRPERAMARDTATIPNV